jgi:hypothetical protein
MKYTAIAGLALAGILTFSSSAQASTFTGFSETADVYFDDAAEFDYDPTFLGGAIFDGLFSVDIGLSADLTTGTLLLTDALLATVLDGTLEDTALDVDNDVADDTLAMLFHLTTGATDYAIATFTGDLDGSGTTDFFTDGVFFEPGTLRIVGATKDDSTVIPLPAGMPLLLGSLGLLALARKKKKA